jgi:GNAT superfamily N-acetyltransferase
MTATLGTLMSAAGRVELRRATITDLPALVGLLTDDPLGNAGEGTVTGPDLRLYERAFRALDADPAHLLVVAAAAGHVVGTLQLSVIPGLSRRGALRAQIEGVRLRRDLRDQRVGSGMVRWAIAEARRRGCTLVQLTTDKTRGDAHRFYARLGFVASHEGLKLDLRPADPP